MRCPPHSTTIGEFGLRMALKATHDGNQGKERNEVSLCLVFSNPPVAYPSISRLIAMKGGFKAVG